jgi:hypothetical protein
MIKSVARSAGLSFLERMAFGRIRSSFNSLRMDRMLVDARRPQDPLPVMEAAFLMDMVAMVAALLPVLVALFVTLP